MKKILVLSDSHGSFDKLLKIYESENPNIVIYLGDGLKDIEELSYIYSNEYYIVKGNCDFFSIKQDNYKIFEINKKKFFITHGHEYDVKYSLDKIKENFEKFEADIIIYGHTHKEYFEKIGENYLFNPGASQDGKYGIILMTEDENIRFINKKIQN